MGKRTFGSLMELMDLFRETGREGGKLAASRMTKAQLSERGRKGGRASAKAARERAAVKARRAAASATARAKKAATKRAKEKRKAE